ncbi:MAG: OmpH family outer membrane protein [Flavobacteriaceae bacterium]
MFMLAPLSMVNAQAKVAHIEVQKLISEMPEVIAAQKELKKLEETYTADMETTYKEFQTKAQTYAADAANQTEITNQSRQKELEGMQKNIQEYQQTVSQDLQKKSVDMMKPLIDKAKAAIDKVASNLGYEYVLDSSAGGSVIIAKGKDIMAEVKKELGF